VGGEEAFYQKGGWVEGVDGGSWGRKAATLEEEELVVK
jgi:hypothetical protein